MTMARPALRRLPPIEDLPTLPRTVLRITERINDPATSARDLARIIAEDQVLTARLLKLVNSSFYGFRRRIGTVTEAVLMIGFEAVRSHLLTTSVFDLFPPRSPALRRGQELLWDHSLGCAVGAKAIGTAMRRDNLEELFVAGLLHDIGKIVLLAKFPAESEEVAARVAAGAAILEAEEAVLGCTHAEIGRRLAEHWNLPSPLVRAIESHHPPFAAEPPEEFSAVVHLADILARVLELGSGGDDRIPPLDPAAWRALRLLPAAFDGILASMLTDFDDIGSFLR
ncbi:MAG: HDOD domain-containing protein [Desulfobacterales bacterium]